uniref:SH3 domain binding glutamate rich protein like 3 n=1 Tax=Pseudonaja textilis TaxID=8673 RepID=A0A670YD54_PSETE
MGNLGGWREGSGIEGLYSKVSMNREEVKQRQSEVLRILDGNRLKYQLVDVSLSDSLLQEMRDKVGKADAVPPQIFNGDEYCGVRKLRLGEASKLWIRL